MNKNVTATVLIIIAVGIYFTITDGILTEAKAVLAVNNQYSSAIQSAVQLIKVRDQVRDSFNNIAAEDHARLDKMVPKTVDNIRLIIDLNNVALKHGFSLKSIKATTGSAGQKAPAQTVVAANSVTPLTGTGAGGGAPAIPIITAPTLDTVSVSFSLDAPYQQFISFMQDLEANLRITDVTQLSVTSSSDGIYGWSVTLQTYWLRSQ